MNNIVLNGGSMHIKNSIIMMNIMLAALVQAADFKKKLVIPTPPPTPARNSPNLSKKDLPAELYTIDATQIGIRTRTGEEQNLQTYLHHSLHHIHEDSAAIHTELNDLQKKIATLSSTMQAQNQLNALENISDTMLTPHNTVLHTKDTEDEKQPLDETYQKLTQEIKEIIATHHRHLANLEIGKQGTVHHTTWLQSAINHCAASSLVVTGLYHSDTILNILSKKTIPMVLAPTIAKLLQYGYVPAGLLFVGLLITNMHHNLRGTQYSHHHNTWSTYFEAHKWRSPQPSHFFVSAAAIIKVITNNIYGILKPTCTMLVNTGIIHVMLTAGATAALKMVDSPL